LITGCALRDLPESFSLSDCLDGPVRERFAGGLGRGCKAPLDGPSSTSEAEAVALASVAFVIVALRFRFCILQTQEIVDRGL